MIQREYDDYRHNELLHLNRYLIATLINFGNSFGGKKKPVELKDIYPIDDFDKAIDKARQLEKQRFEQRAENVLDKYRRYER